MTPGCLNTPPGRRCRSGVVCDWTVDTAYVCWPETAMRSLGGWRTVWSSGRRAAFFRLYIDTVMNAKFGKGAYTFVSALSNWDVWSQNPDHSLMCSLCCVFIVVSMSILKNPTREGAGHGDNITQQQLQFTAQGQ